MTNLTDLHCLFSARIERVDDSYMVEVPEGELNVGHLEDGETYRIAIFPTPDGGDDHAERRQPGVHEQRSPPLAVGEERDVEIEDIGDQGDGIARVERGYVVIIPDTEHGERVTVEITDVQENVAFAEVVERLSYYD